MIALLALLGCENRVEPPDAGDLGVVDAGSTEPGAEDAGPPDLGPEDSGLLDLGPDDTGPPDLGPPEFGEPDLGPADLGTPDLGPPDLGPPDLGDPDLGPMDLGEPDLGPADLGAPDLGPPDLGEPDLGPPDFGPPDLGEPDLGPADLGEPDLGPPDLGPVDMGEPDTGMMDAGDAGPQTCSAVPSLCGANEVCLGEACSCIQDLQGDHYLRADGTVVRIVGMPVVITTTAGVDLDGVEQIYIGTGHGCALRDDDTVWCWPTTSTGNNNGQLGDGTTGMVPASRYYRATQVLIAAGVPLTQVEKINDGASRGSVSYANCAVLQNGELRCWGAPDSSGGGGGSLFNDGVPGNRPYAVQILAGPATPLTGVMSVSLGARHACVIRASSSSGPEVWCWGANIGGPLGQGDQTGRVFPVQVSLPGPVDQVGAGFDATCARVSDQVYCWGSNNSGQVGIGDRTAPENHDGCINFCKLTPTLVIDAASAPLNAVVDLNVGYLSVCAQLSDSSLWCWGRRGSVAQDEWAVPAVIGGPLTNVAEYTTWGSSGYAQALRYLNRDNTLFRGAVQLVPPCP